MILRKIMRGIMVAFSLLMHGIVFFFLYIQISFPLNPYDKIVQTLAVVMFSAVVAVVYMCRNTLIITVGIVAQLLCIFFVCKILNTETLLFAYLLIALLTITLFYIRFPLSAAIVVFEVVSVHICLPNTAAQPLLVFVYVCATLECVLIYMYLSSQKKRHHYYAAIVHLEHALKRVTEVNLAYQNYAILLEEKTLEGERNRITREIHDIIGYTMTNVLMLIQAALHSGRTNWEQAESLLQKAQSHTSSSVNDARLALRRLRESSEQRHCGANLFQHLIRMFADITAIEVCADFANMPHVLPSDVEKAVYRMLQEGMTNAFRHGKATRIDISFWHDTHSFTVRIRDNGQGSGNEIKEGIGIQGMRERIEHLDGSFFAGSLDDGFVVQAIIPLGEQDE